MTQQKDLEELEEERKKKLEILLLALLLSVSSESELISKINKSSKEIFKEIKDVRKASYGVADKYSEEIHKTSDKKRNLIIISAALYMASQLARRVSLSTKSSYIEKAIQAVEQSKPTINRLVNTEIYEANLRKTVSNNKNKMLRWNAINDKKTCSICSSLDGKIFKAEDCPDYPHINCRCMCDIID